MREHAWPPWRARRSPALTGLLEVREGPPVASGCCWRRVTASRARIEDIAWTTARLIMEEICGGTTYCDYWLRASAGRARRYDERMETALTTTLREHIGTRSKPKPALQRRGLVAEAIWRQLIREQQHPLGPILFISERSGVITAGGPDGFVAYQPAAPPPPWRLWEIKHSTTATGAADATKAAYDQLVDRADGYLAQIVIGRNTEPDPVLNAMFKNVLLDWMDGGHHIGVGAAAATHGANLPSKHFEVMHNSFPALQQPGQLEGLLIGVGRYDHFVESVCRKLWIRR